MIKITQKIYMLLDPFFKIKFHSQIMIISDDPGYTSEQVIRLEDAEDNAVVSFPEEIEPEKQFKESCD